VDDRVMRFLGDIAIHLGRDWSTNRLAFSLDLLGTIVSILASILIATQTREEPLLLIFVLWLIGSVSLTVSSYMRSHAWMMVLMCYYTTMNAWGLFNILR
jgi:uncharacterized membrane protein YccC